jgi:large subunit ribosomal protein L21
MILPFKNVVFEIKGKQYNVVSNDQIIYIDYQRNRNSGDQIIFPRVLSYNGEFGHPFLENVKVTGEIVKHRKLKKIVIFKYKAKKRTTKKQGFRPQYTEVKIISVDKI